MESLVSAKRLFAQLHEALAKYLPQSDDVSVDELITHLMSYKHFQIHALIRLRIIENPHNDVHDLSLYGCK